MLLLFDLHESFPVQLSYNQKTQTRTNKTFDQAAPQNNPQTQTVPSSSANKALPLSGWTPFIPKPLSEAIWQRLFQAKQKTIALYKTGRKKLRKTLQEELCHSRRFHKVEKAQELTITWMAVPSKCPREQRKCDSAPACMIYMGLSHETTRLTTEKPTVLLTSCLNIWLTPSMSEDLMKEFLQSADSDGFCSTSGHFWFLLFWHVKDMLDIYL